MALTRAQALATLADELAPIAEAFAAGDYTRGWAVLEPLVCNVLGGRHDGEWAPFSNLVFDVDAKLEPFNVGCMNDGEIDWPKFARHVVRYAEKLRGKAAKAAETAKSSKSKSKSRSASSKPAKAKSISAKSKSTKSKPATSRSAKSKSTKSMSAKSISANSNRTRR